MTPAGNRGHSYGAIQGGNRAHMALTSTHNFKSQSIITGRKKN